MTLLTALLDAVLSATTWVALRLASVMAQLWWSFTGVLFTYSFTSMSWTGVGAAFVLLVLWLACCWQLRAVSGWVIPILRFLTAPFRLPLVGPLLLTVVGWVVVASVMAGLTAWIAMVVAVLVATMRAWVWFLRKTAQIVWRFLVVRYVVLFYGSEPIPFMRARLAYCPDWCQSYYGWVLHTRLTMDEVLYKKVVHHVAVDEMLDLMRQAFARAPDVVWFPDPVFAAPVPVVLPIPAGGIPPRPAPPLGGVVVPPVAPPPAPQAPIVLLDVYYKYVVVHVGALATCSRGAARIRLLKLVSVMPQKTAHEKAGYRACVDVIEQFTRTANVFAPEDFR